MLTIENLSYSYSRKTNLIDDSSWNLEERCRQDNTYLPYMRSAETQSRKNQFRRL